MKRRGLSLVERAVIEQRWRETLTDAQLHALIGDDSDNFVNAAGRVLFVILGACMEDVIDHDMPEVRIIRGAVNALYEQAGDARIEASRRRAIRAGLHACVDLMPILSRKSLIDAAVDLELRLHHEHVNWSDFTPLIERISA